MRTVAIIITLFFIQIHTTGNTQISNSQESNNIIRNDKFGNRYEISYIDSSITIGNSTFHTQGKNDLFLTKYNAKGKCMWAQNFGSKTDDEYHYFITDSLGNSYISGYFGDTVNFHENYLSGSFLVKINSDGKYTWIKNIQVNQLTQDRNNAIYISGYFSDSLDLFGTHMYSIDQKDFFISKLDNTGNKVDWIKQSHHLFELKFVSKEVVYVDSKSAYLKMNTAKPLCTVISELTIASVPKGLILNLNSLSKMTKKSTKYVFEQLNKLPIQRIVLLGGNKFKRKFTKSIQTSGHTSPVFQFFEKETEAVKWLEIDF